MEYNEPLTRIVIEAEKPVQDWYLQPLGLLNIILKKGGLIMVDIEKIKAEIEALKNLKAEEYCAEEVAKIYADFEASREEKIHDLEKALEIFDKFQIVEEVEEAPVEIAEEY